MTNPKVFNIYCDESRITGDRYMVIGGLILNAKSLIELKYRIGEYRNNYSMFYELKWSKISKNRLPHYKALVDVVFDMIKENRINIRTIVVDTKKLDHKRFNDGDSETGFYKMYYQLLFNCFGVDYHRHKNRFVVFPDQKPGKYVLGDLKSRLNNNMFYKQGNRNSPFGSIEASNSKNLDFIQIIDVVIGAIGYHKNKLHLSENTSPAKKEFSEYLAGKFSIDVFGNNKNWGGRKFTIWNIKLQ